MYTKEFVEYLKNERKMARNSMEAYRRDVVEFMCFETSRGIQDVCMTTEEDIEAYLGSISAAGRSASTINRKLASIRSFFNFLISGEHIKHNPAAGIKTPKTRKKTVEYLSMDEVERLLESPDGSIKGRRDRAILEVLYATGIRATELISADVEDINLRMGFITCEGKGSRARIVPLGRPARAALEDYIYNVRKEFVKGGSDEDALFVNYSGRRITRQGLWKILKEYGESADIGRKLTPNILRNSFAVHMLQNGADIKALQELMGHEDISATQVYLAATKSRIKDVYDRTHPRAL